MSDAYKTFSYGTSHEDQFARLYFPRVNPISQDNTSKIPIYIILHGGYWRARYNLDNALIDSLYSFLADQHNYVYVPEYRRVDRNGGFPETNADIILALNKLIDIQKEYSNIDLNRVVLIGHSAGATLSLWICSSLPNMYKIPFKIKLNVALAPVPNLIDGQNMRLSDGGMAIANYMKHEPCANILEPSSFCFGKKCCSYYEASPYFLLPLKTHTLLVMGTRDTDVSNKLIEEYYLKENTNCELLTFDSNHYEVCFFSHFVLNILIEICR